MRAFWRVPSSSALTDNARDLDAPAARRPPPATRVILQADSADCRIDRAARRDHKGEIVEPDESDLESSRRRIASLRRATGATSLQLSLVALAVRLVISARASDFFLFLSSTDTTVVRWEICRDPNQVKRLSLPLPLS